MTDEEQTREDDLAREPSNLQITVQQIGHLLLLLWVMLAVFWATSERSNFPLPMVEVQAINVHLINGTPVVDSLGHFGENPSLFDLYGVGWRDSLLQTYSTAFSPHTWARVDVGWNNIDPLGHLAALIGIGLYTLIGLCVLGTLRIRWGWITRCAVGYVLGLGLAGWIFEQLAIPHMLTRLTTLVTFAVLIVVFGVLWLKRRDSVAPQDDGEVSVGKSFATTRRDLILRCSVWILLVVMVGLSFYHAVTQPPEYWDGLILYLGYARKTHELGGFPVKVVGQVGIGLGANYPHLFEVAQVGVTRLIGPWSPLVGQWSAVWSSLCCTVLVYQIAHRIFRRGDSALMASLVFVSMPYMISFMQWTSNYPLAMLFMAAVLLVSYDWLVTGHRKHALLLLLLAAFASHVNYLMPSLWGLVMLSLAMRWLWERTHPVEDSSHAKHRKIEPRRWWPIWAMLVLALLVSSTWFVRNVIVTGNPVYAFFHETLGGHNINPEVMASADVEWRQNGDGLQQRHLLDNLRIMPLFFGIHPSTSWKFTPVFTALLLPGLLMLVGGLWGWRRTWHFETSERLMWWGVALAGFGGMWFYHLAVSDIYIYQILPMMIPAAIICVIPLRTQGVIGGSIRELFIFGVIMISVPFALGGMKLSGLDDIQGLHALTHPFPDKNLFYNRAYPGDVPMWEEIRENYPNARLLTHDNRHLIFDEFSEIVHLDDLEVQPIYEITDNAARMEFWRDLDIDLYLRIPNEFNHEANSWAGMQDLIDAGLVRRILVHGSGENELYIFPWAE